MEPTKIDRYFAVKAVLKRLEAEVKKLENEVKDELAQRYMEDGTDRMRSPMFGSKAGSISVVVQDPEPPELVEKFQVVDPAVLEEWFDEQKPETDGFALDNMAQFAEWWFVQTGECPEGCTVIRYETEGKPAGIKCVRAVVKDSVVIPMLQTTNLLGEVNRLLLGEGDV